MSTRLLYPHHRIAKTRDMASPVDTWWHVDWTKRIYESFYSMAKPLK